jgi:hypothetical protein
MAATEWAAWVGACTGIGSLAWNVYLKFSSGPKLRVSAFAGMVMMPPPPGNPRFLRINVQNVGTVPTTITNICFYRYASRWSRLKHRPLSPAGLMNEFTGPRIPHKLEVGAEWIASMQQEPHFEETLDKGEMWCAIHHSFSTQPTEVLIRLSSLN